MFHVASIGEYTIMVLDYLGQNLEELLLTTSNKKFSLKSTLMMADQMVYINHK